MRLLKISLAPILFLFFISPVAAKNEGEGSSSLVPINELNKRLTVLWADKETTINYIEACRESYPELESDLLKKKEVWLAENRAKIEKVDDYMRKFLIWSLKEINDFDSANERIRQHKEKGRADLALEFEGMVEKYRTCTLFVNQLVSPTWEFVTNFKRDEALLDNIYEDFCDLCAAAKHDDVSKIRELIEGGVDLNRKDFEDATPLYVASDVASANAVETLLKAGADPNISNIGVVKTFPILIAAFRDNKDKEKEKIIQLLIQHGADVNVRDGRQGGTTLQYLVSKDDLVNASALIKAGADVNMLSAEGFSAGTFAIGNNSLSALSLLLESGFDINLKHSGGLRLIHKAVMKDNIEISRALLKAGADPNVKDDNGETALTIMASIGSLENFSLLVEALLNHDADVNMVNKTGYSPLLLAVSSESVGSVKALLKAGADPNFTMTEDGVTATLLMMAVANNWPEIVVALLDSGAKLDVQNENGQSARSFAEGNPDMLALLSQYE